jgi:4-amino-4-deoxy-L-arabinose transferase-like glycosyltransferase
VPPGINGDEAAVGLNAASISKTGSDSENRFLPLFTNSVNSPDWKQPMTIYASALVFKIFGLSYLNLRLTSVAFVLFSALVIYFLIKELINKKIALVGVIIFLTTPIVMIQSHLAMENIASVPFVSLWLLMMARYTKRPNNKSILLAGVFLGSSIFSYLGMRLIAPVLGIMTVCYLYFLNKNKKSYLNNLKWFLLGSMPFVAVLLLSKFYYPGVLLGQFRPYKIEDYQSLILPFISSFDLSFLFLKGDATPYHSTGKQGMFLLGSLPLFIIGIIGIIRRAKPIWVFSLVGFFLVPLLFGMGSTIYRASRLMALTPFYILIASTGLYFITTLKNKLLRRGAVIAILLLIGLNFSDFLLDYWYQYPQRVRTEFAKPIHTTYERLSAQAKSRNLAPYVEEYLFQSYPGEEKFFQLVYFPDGLPRWQREKKVPPKSVILTDLSKFLKEGVDVVRIGELDYYFIINQTENEI